MSDRSTAIEFPPADRSDWVARVEAVLKGASFDTLVSATYEGVRIEPLYARSRVNRARATRGTTGAWQVAQRVDHPNPGDANAQALVDLEHGASALTLCWSGAPSSRGFGLVAETLDDLSQALVNVDLDLISIRLDAGAAARRAAALFAALVDKRGLDPGRISIDFGNDPIGNLAASGALAPTVADLGRTMADMARDASKRGFRGATFLADGRIYHEAGAGETLELGLVLATAVQYLRLLEENGLSLEEAREQLAFLLVTDADEFLCLAKFRALRRLWASIEEACGLAAKPIRIHAETAWRMTTKRDPWTNIMRATIASFSAGLGGADVITVLPFTIALGLPDELARRIARNTQLVLLEESNLAKVVDPAAGAGGFESLTNDLCEKAWAIFRDVERHGAMIATLQAGIVQAKIAVVREARSRAVATRKQPITGTSEFADIGEALVEVLHPQVPLPQIRNQTLAIPAAGNDEAFAATVTRVKSGALIEDWAGPQQSPAVTSAPMLSQRDAEPFERLRDASDDFLAKTGARPRIFLACLGSIAAFAARAAFATNLFAAGGIEAVATDSFDTGQDAAAAFRVSRARVACLCSSDAVYAEHGLAAVAALKAAGAVHVCLAGRPNLLVEAFEDVGVGTFIDDEGDALATLTTLHAMLIGG